MSSARRLLLRLAAGLGLATAAGAAAAASYTFPGAMPKDCSGSGGSYTCKSLTLGYNDTITIAGTKPATIRVKGDFETDNARINSSGSASDLTLIVEGRLRFAYQAVIVANIQADRVVDRDGQATITGNIATTIDDIELNFATVVNGSLSTTSGRVFVANAARVTGTITSSKGEVRLDYAARVDGSIDTAGSVTLAQDTVVGGSVTAATQQVDIGYAAVVGGSVTTSSGAISLAQSARVTACVTSTSSSTITLGYQASAGGVCCGNGCSNTCVSNGSGAAMPPACAASPPPQAGVDHYEVSLPSASLACTGSTVTVTACADASSPCTNTATSLAGKTATLAASAGTLAATTVSFDAKGLATTTLSHPAATDGATVSLSLSGEPVAGSKPRRCCPDGATCSAADSCSTTFHTAGFIISASSGGAAATVPTQTAGSTSGSYVLRAVKTGSTTKACEAALSGAQTVDWSLQCLDPITCSSGNLLTLTGSAAAAIASNPASGVGASTAVPMNFDAAGQAPFSFSYADVGRVRLSASKTVAGATLAGSSNAFVVRPASLAIASIRQTADPKLPNPAAGGAGDAVFVRAGESFSATVTALGASGAATPNFGRETAPEGVQLAATLVLPAGGAAGTLGNATLPGGSFSSGAATATQLSYSEVGIVTLAASLASGSYLGAGAVSGPSTGNVGRFVPARFAVSGTSITHRSGLACTPASSFTYLGETFRLGLTLTAQNLAGATTANYSGDFARFDPASAGAWQLAGRDGATVFTVASGRLSLGSATGSWSNGVASGLTLTAAALRAAAADGPFSAAFGVAPVDSDGVTLGSFDMASAAGGVHDRAGLGTLALRFGRLRLSSAIGAADRPLALPAEVQHWTGSTWDTNTLDSCTTVPASAMNYGNLRRTLTTADTAASAALSFAAGIGALRLAAPAAGRSGTYDVALSLGSTAPDVSCLQSWAPGTGDAATAGANLPFLRGAWCSGSPDKDPSARASFGLARTRDGVIYRREHY